jgi:hypothetical protein
MRPRFYVFIQNPFTTIPTLAPLGRVSALCVLMSVAAPVTAQAENLLTFNDLDQIESLLGGFGSVSRDTDGEDVAMFRGRIDGSKYALHFYDCDGMNDCKSASFSAFFNGDAYRTDLKTVNAFNSEYRFGTASIDEDGDLELGYSFTLFGGISRQMFDDTIDWWRVVLQDGTSFFASDTDLSSQETDL